MEVTIITLTKEALGNRDLYALEIDGKRVFSVFEGEPEENTISRNFNDVYKLDDILEKLWLAGKAGEDLTIGKREVNEY